MAKVTVMGLDVVTEGSGHQCVGMAVSVCLTPPAPPPPGPGFMPIPYPLTGMVSEGIDDPPMRTKMMGDIILTVGSQMKLCHGNEAGTMNEVVSLTITKRCAPIVAAVLVWTELGMTGMTGAFGLMNINPAAGAGGSASDASGDAGGGGGGGGGAGSGGPSGPGAPPAGGGTGGGGSGAGGGAGSGGGRQNDNPNAAPGGASSPQDRHVCQNGHPVDVATGYVIDQQVDFHLPGLIPVRWKRYYSSARHRDHDATLGAGWAHGFEQRLDDHERVLTLRDEEGREVWFDRVAVGQRSFHRRDRLELLRVKEDEYTVTSIETRQIRRFRALRPEGACLLVSIEDAYGNAVRLTYEGERLASITDTTGRIVNVRWRDGRIASVSVTARGQRQLVVTYAYTKRGCLSHVVDPAGYSDFFEYDERNRMVAATIKNGTRFTYDYDPRTGRCARTGGPNGLYECAFERNAAKGITVSRGEETRIFHWNELGLVTKEYLPDGSLLQENAYDADGVLVAAANGAGEGTQIYHDHRGNPLRVRDPAGRETLSVYHDDRLQKLSLPDGEVREFAYNPQGDLIAVRSNRGRWVSFAYDARGRMIDARDESGGYFGRVYDEENNLVRETDARGAHTHYRYDALGRAVGMADALGAVTQASFDARGARTSLRTPDGASWRWSYDAMGAVAKETDPLGHTTHFENAGMGFPVAVHTPDGRTWKLGYTSRERLASVENPLGEVYTFQYDDGGRVITEQTFDGRTLRYAYDAAERISGVTYPDETSRGFEYDRLGHLVVDRGSDGSTVTLRRDVHGRLREALQTEGEAQTVTDHTRLDRNEDGFLTAVHRGDTSIHFQHDVRGRVVARELPGGIITRYAHAPTGELIGLEHAGETVTFGRDLLGREVRRGLRATVVESRYDAMDRLIEQRVSAPKPGEGLPEGMSALVSRRWSYDRKGRLTRIEDSRWGETTYGYGSLDELVSAQRGDVREAFRYDGAHSITAMTTHRGESVTQALPPSLHKARADRLKRDDWEVGPGNQLIRTEKANYVYDRRGRRVEKHTRTTDGSAALTRYEWDLRDRLRAVHRPDGKIVKIAYDAFGRRTEKLIVSAETGDVESGTRLLWDGDVVCADSETTRGTRTWAHQGFEPVVQTQNGVSYLVICDQVGTPKELIDGYGRVAWAAAHSAWGTVTEERGDTAEGAAPITCPFRLLGQYFDEETGLAATRYRYWDAEVGRWLSEDPLGIGGGLNLFGFDASPTGWVDPLGLATESGDGHGVKLTGKGKEVLRDPALQAMKDKTVAEAIKERGGGAGQVQQVASDLREARLGDVANQAATGDADAVTAIKMVKQASSKKQKYGGK